MEQQQERWKSSEDLKKIKKRPLDPKADKKFLKAKKAAKKELAAITAFVNEFITEIEVNGDTDLPILSNKTKKAANRMLNALETFSQDRKKALKALSTAIEQIVG